MAGLEETVRRRSLEQYHPDGGINNVGSLAGREIASYFPNLNSGVEEFQEKKLQLVAELAPRAWG